ncbi:MAG: hypothetical protein KF799_08440 [Bdellovibrionales bacterium]|nr:hypothetical protein [Bdellovibrionales bacterium]
MKSQFYKLLFVIALGTAVAQGAFADPAAQDQGLWAKFTTTVKVKVKEWMDYWNTKPDAPAQQQNAANKQNGSGSTNVGTGTTAAPTPPVTEPASVTSAGAGAGAPLPNAPQQQTAAPTQQPVAAKPAMNEENKALRQQKVFERNKGTTLQELQSLRDSVKAKPLFKAAQPARPGKTVLPRTKVGVPVADFKKMRATKVVPRLDIGYDVLVSREDFAMGDISFGIGRPSDLKKLPQPAQVSQSDFQKALGQPVTKAFGAKGLQANMRGQGKPVTSESIAKIVYAIKPVSDVALLPYKPLSEEHLKMVAALILFDRGNHCHMIMGLFHQLALNEKTRTEANYHLGACADSLKMEQVAFDRLSQVVAAEDKEFGSQALDLLVKDIPLIYEKDFYHLIKGIKSFKNLVSEASQDAVAYRTAKGAYRAGDYKTSSSYAGRVNSGTEYFDEARFLTAMNSLALGDKPAALKKLEELSASLEARKVQDKNIRALTAVNLARMHFSLKNYAKAHESYMQVPKDHPLWVQALIEQGWTQVALEDYSGAIGNMYSLHSPYFRAVYQPESFVVRTIGYLNICQYGDAYRTLTQVEKEYREALDRVRSYSQMKSQPLDMYATVKAYIKGKSTENVDGVPYQVWREMARRKDFLNLQTALNEKQDEARRYDGVNEKIKQEKANIRFYAEQAKKRFDQWKAQLAKINSDRSLAKNRTEWENNLRRERDLTIGHRFKLQILELSRQGFLDFQGKAQKKLDTETASISLRAGQSLSKHAKSMTEEMGRVLDNNEFLRYEVFSGSGENIRYQVSGGVVGKENRIPASIKPTKMMNWNFDGEFWEDEIGSYRSSLQNVCPSASSRTATTVNED